ncbi:conserved hypothetical protein [Theileria equi strain WA]|uniref:Uncharacterized protein n=1 Tax=Theileria equi strain WA TaxID=1537102 RepID=L1LEE3_THEEQ|nr:conserved hypothetical protein [Theileria equi strain WA]EKX73777.1 conserved hypothetical protein [Theileria equi strain WA]|eukprot:XP_004833229.1 conserved hypothetical protein [Theileria equi strain WA]
MEPVAIDTVKPCMETHVNNLPAESDTAYAEGDGISGGPCGEWLRFQVYRKSCNCPGIIRMYLEQCEETCFKTTIFIGESGDERDMLRAEPSWINTYLSKNTIQESTYNNFAWDVCFLNEFTYNVRYKISLKGRFLLYVKLDGNDISGSPFEVYISDGRPSSLFSRVTNKFPLRCVAMPLIKPILDIIDDEKWDVYGLKSKNEEFQVKKNAVLSYLDKHSLSNEIVLNICDKNGEPVTIALPYIKAWSTNHGKVIGVQNIGNGIVSVKYIVVIPKDKIKEVSNLEKDTTLILEHTKNFNSPCSVYLEVDGKGVYGSPFIPEIINTDMLQKYYESIPDDLDIFRSNIQSLLNKNDFDSCLDAIQNMFDSTNEESHNAFILELISKLFLSKLNSINSDNVTIESYMHKIDFIKSHSLGELHKFVEKKYQVMLKHKTSGILSCIKELNSYSASADGGKGGFNNLGDVILNYRRIGDELRKLHRYELADKVDAISDKICEEIELSRLENIIKHKEEKISQLKIKVKESKEKLNSFKDTVYSKYENMTPKPVPKVQINKSVQTVSEENVTCRLLPLVKSRCNDSDTVDEVEQLIDTHWRRCSNHDIHSTVNKVLKSSIRLKNAINEIFFYYSKEYETDDNMLKYGIIQTSLERFHVECKINKTLMSSKKRLNLLFEKFSIYVPNGERLIPEHMWCVYLRELAYLNLLYIIAESGDVTLFRDTRHPSRLVSFHHFCESHLLDLYYKLYTSRPEFQKHVIFHNTKKSVSNYKYQKGSGQIRHFISKEELSNFINNKGSELVLSNLDVEPLKLLFKHYTRLSMYGKQNIEPKDFKCDDSSWMSTAMFVVLVRDFSIIPGYIDGSNVQHIADGVISSRNQDQSDTVQKGRLYFNDFVAAIVNVVSSAIYKICMDRHTLYSKSIKDRMPKVDVKKDSFDEIKSCIQSKESVVEDIKELIRILGISNILYINTTIDAIYGPDALDYLCQHHKRR